MRNLMNQLRGCVVIAGASTLLACASVQTTEEFAVSRGYHLTDIDGITYFCPDKPSEVQGNKIDERGPTDEAICVTRREILELQYREANPPDRPLTTYGATAAVAGQR
jgi:hypothetical protein